MHTVQAKALPPHSTLPSQPAPDQLLNLMAATFVQECRKDGKVSVAAAPSHGEAPQSSPRATGMRRANLHNRA